MTRRLPIAPALALLAAGVIGGAAPAPAPLDAIARAYVALSLEAGTHEPEYIDAYYGPPEWAAAAKARPRSVATLRTDAAALISKAEAVDPARLTPIERQRRTFLIGQLTAARTRLAMRAGERFSFDDEAQGLFGVRPVPAPLASFDATLAEIDKLVPGDGLLWQRVDSFFDGFIVPPARLDAVMRAAIAECRRRTQVHIPLPANEKFTLELVKNKPWSGYNYYKGNATSLIQVNTDLPVRIGRAVDLGCHEGYPGHHVYNLLLEQRLAKARGWVEFTVYPLYGPQSLIAEGSANYGIDLAFPGDERAAFEAKTLYPLAGLDPASAPRYAALAKAMEHLSGARFAITRDYLDGRIDRATALALTQKYGLVSKARAEQSIGFDDHYRSYVINYGLGKDMVQAHVEAAGPGQAARWTAMTRLLSEPMSPTDLTAH